MSFVFAFYSIIPVNEAKERLQAISVILLHSPQLGE
jgi:hypothetical protein